MLRIYLKKILTLTNKRKGAGLKHCIGPKVLLNTQILMIFLKILNNAIYIKDAKYGLSFHDSIADMVSNKKFNPLITESLIRGRKLMNSLVFITESCFSLRKTI